MIWHKLAFMLVSNGLVLILRGKSYLVQVSASPSLIAGKTSVFLSGASSVDAF